MSIYVLLLVSQAFAERANRGTKHMYKIQRTVVALIIGTMAITGVTAVEMTGPTATVAGPKPCC
jgi:hypothetical protein